MRRPRASDCAAVLVAALLAACSVYDPALLNAVDASERDEVADVAPPPMDAGTDAPPPAHDAGMDAGTDAGTPEDAGCTLRHPPPRPTVTDGPDIAPLYFGVSRVGLGVAAGAAVSYDLDEMCTTMDDPQAECAPPPGFTPPNDGLHGEDNTFAQSFVPLLSLVEPNFGEDANNSIRSGTTGLLLVMSGWNGTPNDPVVDVASLSGILGRAAGSPADRAAPGFHPPRWDGTDEWTVAFNSFIGGDPTRPIARDTSAYVADGVLVAHPRDGSSVTLSGTDVAVLLRLNNMEMTARISDDHAHLLDGINAGRWTLDSIFDALPATGLCPGSDFYTSVQAALGRSADLRAEPGDPQPFLPCEAISVGFGFEATRIVVADYGFAMEPVDMCRAMADAGPTDAGPGDAGPADTGPADTGPADTGPADTGPADTGAPDGGGM